MIEKLIDEPYLEESFFTELFDPAKPSRFCAPLQKDDIWNEVMECYISGLRPNFQYEGRPLTEDYVKSVIMKDLVNFENHAIARITHFDNAFIPMFTNDLLSMSFSEKCELIEEDTYYRSRSLNYLVGKMRDLKNRKLR